MFLISTSWFAPTRGLLGRQLWSHRLISLTTAGPAPTDVIIFLLFFLLLIEEVVFFLFLLLFFFFGWSQVHVWNIRVVYHCVLHIQFINIVCRQVDLFLLGLDELFWCGQWLCYRVNNSF